MDEWILVSFTEFRDVLVDGTICGMTNKTMMVQLGNHIVTLGGDQNYISPPMPVAVFNTSQQQPLKLVFTLA